jgi:hypothetical protein
MAGQRSYQNRGKNIIKLENVSRYLYLCDNQFTNKIILNWILVTVDKPGDKKIDNIYFFIIVL